MSTGDREQRSRFWTSQRVLRRDMTVRQVAHDFPATRAVFIAYGEPPERTPFGHLEPLESFAARHGVPVERLLADLSEAAGVPADTRPPTADWVHRPFVAAALFVTLTIGAGWGAWLLWEIGRGGSFSSAPVAHVVAHGEAQLWGFLSLFVAGIALRWIPMATGSRSVPVWQWSAIWLLLVGGVTGGYVWALWPSAVPWLGVSSGAALAAATVLILFFFLSRLGKRLSEPWVWAVLAAGVWWSTWGVFTLWMRWKHASTGPGMYTLDQREWIIELSVLGLAVNAVFGFGTRLLPGIVGGQVKRPWVAAALALHNLGVVGLGVKALLSEPALGAAGLGLSLLGAGCFVVAMPGLRRLKRVSGRPEHGHPDAGRYVQLALFWLIMGVLMLFAGEMYAIWTRHPVPHAWRGAARHALTVGFLTTLILGVGQRIIPILGHTLLAWPSLVRPTLVLIGLGNLLRVGLETATLVWTPAFAIMPVSSWLELAALVLFAANSLRTLWPAPDPLQTTGRVTELSRVAVLLAHHPAMEDALMARGIRYLARARSVPQELTLASMAQSEGWDPQELVKLINDLLSQQT